MHYYNYSTETNDIRKLLLDLWEVDDLEKLHESTEYPRFTMEDNSNTEFHKKFYDKLREGWPEFMEAYIKIVKAPPYMSSEYLYQTTPTLRIHLVNNWATPEFHRDTQKGYDHPENEKNWFIPLTNCYGNNSVWIESEPDKLDFHPIKMKYGDIISWDGGKLLHGNKINDTLITRVSFDYRTLSKSYYDPEKSKTSGTNGLEFKVGSYYEELQDE